MVKKYAFSLFIGVLFLLIPGKFFAQSGTEGMRLKETKVKTLVYEIKIEGLKSSADSDVLDHHLELKSNVINSHTDFSKGICTVEILKSEPVDILKDVIEFAGFSVAKSFD